MGERVTRGSIIAYAVTSEEWARLTRPAPRPGLLEQALAVRPSPGCEAVYDETARLVASWRPLVLQLDSSSVEAYDPAQPFLLLASGWLDIDCMLDHPEWSEEECSDMIVALEVAQDEDPELSPLVARGFYAIVPASFPEVLATLERNVALLHRRNCAGPTVTRRRPGGVGGLAVLTGATIGLSLWAQWRGGL